MAFFADAPAPARQPSPAGLTLNFSSNNPFRNRAASPSPNTPTYGAVLAPPAVQQPARPMSTNPFLDDSEFSQPNPQARANAAALSADIFSELSLLDSPSSNEPSRPNGLNGAGAYVVREPSRAAPRRPDAPPPSYRPSGDRPPRPPRAPDSPEKNVVRAPRPRRASESSVMEKDRRPRLDRMDRDRDDGRERTESEERRRRERRKEREERHKKEKEKVRNGEKRTRKPQGLDLIDKLDVTGIYGQGLFHHDGPFDACNPHRNAKKDRRAPMQAFPADSANMQLGGAGPLRSRLDLDKFHGRGEESFSEYALTRKADTTIIDPTKGLEPVHGVETYGLGTSTFLEGAPASKSALQRRDSEDPELGTGGGGGLSRKKSLVQRFRGMSGSRRNGPGEMQGPDDRYGPYSPASQAPQAKAISAGGPVQARYNRDNEVNPFDNDYEAAFERKGTQIRIAAQDKPSVTRPRAGSSPRAPALYRAVTSEGRVPSRGRGSSGEEERPKEGGVSGFLSRMKSVKGGPRRQRNAE